MKNWPNVAIITTDRNLKLQYLAALGLNLYQRAICKAMIREVKFGTNLRGIKRCWQRCGKVRRPCGSRSF
jgi:hypothetical protein